MEIVELEATSKHEPKKEYLNNPQKFLNRKNAPSEVKVQKTLAECNFKSYLFLIFKYLILIFVLNQKHCVPHLTKKAYSQSTY